MPKPIHSLLEPGALKPLREHIVWLPNPGPWRYLADPFGLQRGGCTHVFVEAYDYRRKHAVIEHHELDAELNWRGKSTVLARPFHLSYPYVFEHEGEVFMVPESHQADEIALYRARRFPDDWVRVGALLPDVPGAEASLIQHGGLWWMFYTLVGPKARDQTELHLAYATTLLGPWQEHAANPVLRDRSGARPGGTPFIDATGCVVLPVQDCHRNYGGAIRLLRFSRLDTSGIEAEHLPTTLTGDQASSTHQEGLHTLAQCGSLTLIDTKRVSRSRERQLIDFRRRLIRLGKKIGA